MQQALQVTGRASPALLLVALLHAVYVADAHWMEPSILTTMDMKYDGLGFMLVFGNLAWVPFTYCLQARYLVDQPQVGSLAPGAAWRLRSCCAPA